MIKWYRFIVWEQCSTREIGNDNFVINVWVPEVGNTTDTPNPPGWLPLYLFFYIHYLNYPDLLPYNTSDIFPWPPRLHANDRRKTEPSVPTLLADFSDPKEKLLLSKPKRTKDRHCKHRKSGSLEAEQSISLVNLKLPAISAILDHFGGHWSRCGVILKKNKRLRNVMVINLFG